MKRAACDQSGSCGTQIQRGSTKSAKRAIGTTTTTIEFMSALQNQLRVQYFVAIRHQGRPEEEVENKANLVVDGPKDTIMLIAEINDLMS